MLLLRVYCMSNNSCLISNCDLDGEFQKYHPENINREFDTSENYETILYPQNLPRKGASQLLARQKMVAKRSSFTVLN